MTDEWPDFLARHQVPKPQRWTIDVGFFLKDHVAAAGDGLLTIRREGSGPSEAADLGVEHKQFFSRRQVPKACLAVAAIGKGLLSIRGKHDIPNGVRMCRQRSDLLTGVKIPQAYGEVAPAGTGESAPAVRRNSDAID